MRKQRIVPPRILPRGASISPAGFPAPAMQGSHCPLLASALGHPDLSMGAVVQPPQGAVTQSPHGPLSQTPQGVVNLTPHGIVNQSAYGTMVQKSQGAVLQTTQAVFNQTPRLCVGNQRNQSLTRQNPYKAGCKKILPRTASTGQAVMLDTDVRKDGAQVSQPVSFPNVQRKTRSSYGMKSKGNKKKQRIPSAKLTDRVTDIQMEDLIQLVRDLLLIIQSPVTGDPVAFKVLTQLIELVEVGVKYFIPGCCLHQIIVQSVTDKKTCSLEDLLKATIITKQGWAKTTGPYSSPKESPDSSPKESTREEGEPAGEKMKSNAGDSLYDDTRTQHSQLTKCHETADTDTDSEGKDFQSISDTDAHVQEETYHDTDQEPNEDIGHTDIGILGTKCQDVDDSDINEKSKTCLDVDKTDTDSHAMLDNSEYTADLHGGLILKVEDIKMESSDCDQSERDQSTQDCENNKTGTTHKGVHCGDISQPPEIKDMYKVVQDNPIVLQRMDTTQGDTSGYAPVYSTAIGPAYTTAIGPAYTTAIGPANFVNLGMIPSIVNTTMLPASKIATGRDKKGPSQTTTLELNSYLSYLEYHCFLCGPPTNSNIPFESQTHLDNHMFTKHVVGSKNQGNLECPVCNIKMCHKIKKRTKAVRKACTPLLRHLVSRHKWKVPDYIFTKKCNYPSCKYRATTSTQWNAHMQIHENVLCDACGDVYKRNVATKHLRKCPGNPDKGKALKEQCPVCNKQVNNLKTHMDTHDRIVCYVCSKMMNRGSLETHLFYRHQIDAADRPMVECSVCDYQTIYKHDLRLHVKRCHMAKKLVRCPTCHKMLPELSLHSHIWGVHGDRKFSCPHCPYKAKNKANLQTHLQLHSGTKDHSCEWCPYKTAFKFNLPKHQQKCRHNPKNKI